MLDNHKRPATEENMLRFSNKEQSQGADPGPIKAEPNRKVSCARTGQHLRQGNAICKLTCVGLILAAHSAVLAPIRFCLIVVSVVLLGGNGVRLGQGCICLDRWKHKCCRVESQLRILCICLRITEYIQVTPFSAQQEWLTICLTVLLLG